MINFDQMIILEFTASHFKFLTSCYFQQNTHLISRKSEGLKYTKAQKWGTKIINARWLSDIVLYGVVSITLFFYLLVFGVKFFNSKS